MSDNAKQFKAFDALKGLKEEIEKQEKNLLTMPEYSEDHTERIAKFIAASKKGDFLKFKYFCDQQIIIVEGSIKKIDSTSRFMIIDNEKIYFKNIMEILNMDDND